MDRILISILVSALAIMGVTVWLAYGSRPPPIPDRDRRFMHCPNCEKESPYEAKRFEKECPYCSQKGLVATKESIRKTGRPDSPFGRMTPPLLVEVTILAAVLYWYASWRLRRAETEGQLHMECGSCHQRIRYKAERIGQIGKCPRCKRRFYYPPAAPDEDEENSHWWQLEWWRRRPWWKRFNKTA
jgi:uncharacterized paraquat-inducible protein A